MVVWDHVKLLEYFRGLQDVGGGQASTSGSHLPHLTCYRRQALLAWRTLSLLSSSPLSYSHRGQNMIWKALCLTMHHIILEAF